MKIKFLLFVAALFISITLKSQPVISLQQIASGFTRPVGISNAGDGRLFIVEQAGRIKIIDTNGVVLATPFLDITAKVNDSQNEQGLFSIAFHPDYKNNGYFYVNYTDNTVGTQSSARNTNVSRFKVNPTNPNRADTAEFIIFEAIQYSWNHNGGDLHFGPDGYLYIALGDGGSSCDPNGYAQNMLSYLGKMLRIDVDGGTPYVFPPSNPYYGMASRLNEIWAFGLRNPWRFSFDRLTGDMWIGDVGQNSWEEIDFQPASSTGGINYGWKCYEGTAYGTCTPVPSGCSSITQTPPIHTLVNNSDCSITGGYVYRGCEHPNLYGHYVFADYCSGRFWTIYRNGAAWATTSQGQPNNISPSSFGEDINGEIYVADLGGGIYKVNEASTGLNISLAKTDESCAPGNDGAANLTVSGGATPYGYEWSDGASTQDLSGLNEGSYSVTVTDAHDCVETGSVDLIRIEPFNPTVNANGATVFCEGESVTLSTQAGFANYLWKINGSATAVTTNSIDADVMGDYTVDVTDINGCMIASSPFSVTVNDLPPIPIITQNNNELSATPGGISYQWYFEGNELTGITSPTFTPSQNGNYTVKITDSNGCSSFSDLYPFVATGITESSVLNGIRVYPNPFNESVTISYALKEKKNISVKVFDILGKERLVISEVQDAGERHMNIPAEVFRNSGVYYLQISETVYIKLIKN